MLIWKLRARVFLVGGSDRRWWIVGIGLLIGAIAVGLLAARVAPWPPPVALLIAFPALLLAQARALPLLQVRPGSPPVILKHTIGPFWSSIRLDPTTLLQETPTHLTIAESGHAYRSLVIPASTFPSLDFEKTREALTVLARTGLCSQETLTSAGFFACDGELAFHQFNLERTRRFRSMLVALVMSMVAFGVILQSMW